MAMDGAPMASKVRQLLLVGRFSTALRGLLTIILYYYILSRAVLLYPREIGAEDKITYYKLQILTNKQLR